MRGILIDPWFGNKVIVSRIRKVGLGGGSEFKVFAGVSPWGGGIIMDWHGWIYDGL